MSSQVSGVSRVAIGLHLSTIDSCKPRHSCALAICPGCLGLGARARAYVYKYCLPVFSFMREQITLSTLDTLDIKLKVFDFKRFLMSRVVSRVGLFLSRVGFPASLVAQGRVGA